MSAGVAGTTTFRPTATYTTLRDVTDEEQANKQAFRQLARMPEEGLEPPTRGL